MNFIYVGDFRQAHSTERYIAKELRGLGHTVVEIDEWRKDSLVAIYEEMASRPQCEWIFLFCKLQLPGYPFRSACDDPGPVCEFINRVQAIPGVRSSVCWVFDLMRAEFHQGRYRWAQAIANTCDLFVTTDSGLGIGECIRQGYPGPLELPLGGRDRFKPKVDFLLLGSIYGERKPWFREMRSIFGDRFRIIQDGTHCDNLFSLMRSVRVVVGPSWPSYPGYWSNRLYLVTGYGGFLACPEVEGMSGEGWIPGIHYHLIPESPLRCATALDNLSRDEEYRNRITKQGRAFVTQWYTMRHRVQELVSLLKRKRLAE